MRCFFAALAIVFLWVGCMHAPLESRIEPDDCSCPEVVQPPNPIPCIRVGVALASEVDWLLWMLDDQSWDATDLADVMNELDRRAEQWDTCSAELTAEVMEATRDTAQP